MAEETQVETPEVKTLLSAASTDTEVKMAGEKDMAQNDQQILIEKTTMLPAPEKPAFPLFFVKPDTRNKISVDILYSKTDGKIVSVSKVGLLPPEDLDSYSYLGHSVETFEFTQPNYEELSTYRQKAAIFRRDLNRMLVDSVNLRSFLIIWHLKEWSIRDAEGNKVPLTFDASGALSDDSIKTVMSMSPAILDVAISIFEKDIMLT